MIIAITRLIGKNLNDNGTGVCIDAVHYPPHHCRGYNVTDTCEGYEIPCGHRIAGAEAIDISKTFSSSIPIVIIIISLCMIYASVREQEKKNLW